MSRDIPLRCTALNLKFLLDYIRTSSEGDFMRRREFIILLGSGLAAWPFGAHGQQEKLWRIGMLETISPALNAANLAAFRNGLRQLGYVESQSYVIEYRSVEGRAALSRSLRPNWLLPRSISL